MDTTLLRKIDLENGLKLQIHDVSKGLAGSRWYVGFIARIEIPLAFFAGHADSSGIDIEKMKDVLGDTIRFEQKHERHFIDEKEKDALLNDLMDNFLASTLPYFSGKDFAIKYVLKTYKKRLEKASWYKT